MLNSPSVTPRYLRPAVVGVIAASSLLLAAAISVLAGQMPTTPIPPWVWPLVNWVALTLVIFGACLLGTLVSRLVLERGDTDGVGRLRRVGYISLAAGFLVTMAMAVGWWPVVLTALFSSISLILQIIGAVALALSVRIART